MHLLKLAVLAPHPSGSPSINGNFLLIGSFVSLLLLAGVEIQTFKLLSWKWSLVKSEPKTQLSYMYVNMPFVVIETAVKRCLVWLSIQGKHLNGGYICPVVLTHSLVEQVYLFALDWLKLPTV